jgi:hypothetical protein
LSVRSCGRVAIAASVWALLMETTFAADMPTPSVPRAETPETGSWVVDAALYGWAAGLSGSVATLPPLPAANINLGFSDLLSNLDGAFMGSVYARRDRFVVFGDLMYTKLSADRDFATNVSTTVSLTSSSLIGTGGIGYRVVADPNYSLDLLAGARLYNVSTDATLRIGGAFSRSGSTDETWVDPMVGAKFSVKLSDNWSLNSWAFAGGFGVSSQFSWDLFGGVGYNFNNKYSMVLGYRGLGVDYADGGYVYDVVQKGPVIGFKINF